MTEPKNHNMKLNLYLFCAEYYYNHEVEANHYDNQMPIHRYYQILQGNAHRFNDYSEQVTYDYDAPGVFYKRLYKQYKQMYFEQLEFNIRYCELQLQKDTIKNKNKNSYDRKRN